MEKTLFDVVGYVMDEASWCPGCLPPVPGCECAEELDYHGKCTLECSGNGPFQIIRWQRDARRMCVGCGVVLKEVAA